MTQNQAVQEETTAQQVEEAIERSKAEDPVFRFIFNNWQRLLTALVVVAVGAYIYRGYTQTQERSLAGAAELYMKVRDSLDQFETAQKAIVASKDAAPEKQKELNDKLAEAKKLVEERLAAFSDIQKAPYKDIATLYRALFALDQNDFSKAAEILSGVKQALNQPDGKDTVVLELQALVLGRALLDVESKRAEGIDLLKLLAEKGQYANAVAALALARVADTPTEKEQAMSLIDSVRSKFPEQSDLLKDEMTRL